MCINSLKENLGRPRHRWSSIQMGLTETELEGVYWINQAQNSDIAIYALNYPSI
jgi:hypothetical protein